MVEEPEDDMLGWDETVFRNEHVFELDYLPESFKHRETQMENLKYALRPAVRGSRPLNVIARGPPGTGKTTATQILFDELRAATDVQAIRINCQVDSTKYAIFNRLFTEIFEYEPPSSGISFKELFAKITRKLAEDNQVLVVALDDVNYLFYDSEASDILYSLLRAHEAHKGAKIGAICISSDLSLNILDDLDSRVESVFRPEEIYFDKYGVSQISDILHMRVSRGFQEGVVGEDELHRVSQIVEDNGGDLRIGINLLRRAGFNAEMRGSREISLQDIEKANKDLEDPYLSQHINGLGDSEQFLLELVAKSDGRDEDWIQSEFLKECNGSHSQYLQTLHKLNEIGLIEIQGQPALSYEKGRILRNLR